MGDGPEGKPGTPGVDRWIETRAPRVVRGGKGSSGHPRTFDGSDRDWFDPAMTDPLERQREMVARHPRNELARFSLGKALFDRGDWTAAREQLAVALERRPDWMVVQILVGKCDLELGRKDAARAAFERGFALAIEQHHEGPQEELQQLLADLKE